MNINWLLLIVGVLLLILAIYKLVFDRAPQGHEDDDGFHYD